MIKNEKGVTLVELLIVIVILGIIAAISVPAVGNIVENSEKDAVISEASTIADSARLACAAEDHEACKNQPVDEDGTDALYFIGNDDNEAEEDLTDYLDDFDGDYAAVRINGEWAVAVYVNGYSLVVDPTTQDPAREDVVEGTGAWDPDNDQPNLESGGDITIGDDYSWTPES